MLQTENNQESVKYCTVVLVLKGGGGVIQMRPCKRYHSRYGTIKIPLYSKAISAKFSRPSSAMLTSWFEWTSLERDDTIQSINQTVDLKKKNFNLDSMICHDFKHILSFGLIWFYYPIQNLFSLTKRRRHLVLLDFDHEEFVCYSHNADTLSLTGPQHFQCFYIWWWKVKPVSTAWMLQP